MKEKLQKDIAEIKESESIFEGSKEKSIANARARLDEIDDELKDALDYHREELNQLDLDNRRGQNGQKYSVVRELSTGMRMLMNSIKQRTNATTSAEKAAANKEIEKSIERNLKNIVKAPIALTTKDLKDKPFPKCNNNNYIIKYFQQDTF